MYSHVSLSPLPVAKPVGLEFCHRAALLCLLACLDLPFIAGCLTRLPVALASMLGRLLTADTHDSA